MGDLEHQIDEVRAHWMEPTESVRRSPGTGNAPRSTVAVPGVEAFL